jgi:hypothetical protein
MPMRNAHGLDSDVEDSERAGDTIADLRPWATPQRDNLVLEYGHHGCAARFESVLQPGREHVIANRRYHVYGVGPSVVVPSR